MKTRNVLARSGDDRPYRDMACLLQLYESTIMIYRVCGRILEDLARLVRKWKRARASSEMILWSFQEIAQREHKASGLTISDSGDSDRDEEDDTEELEPADSALDNVVDEGAGDADAAGGLAMPPAAESGREPNGHAGACNMSDETEPGAADRSKGESNAIFEGGILEYEDDEGKIWQVRRSGIFFGIRPRGFSHQGWSLLDGGTLYDHLEKMWRRLESEGGRQRLVLLPRRWPVSSRIRENRRRAPARPASR